ncbi:hypothetical protein [Stygiolobus caldivivus]|uniref:Uncharacterized protein n=1 Tax=Stygiolobus caldivivus TaxID=2824673 RepID=A0A8D5U635_9CREN|nr:hypothetical protein [Stygiolobus caldivivus]BCU69993.1 hypothetical protein KN1_12900 [Stygiolobus caldivivus]
MVNGKNFLTLIFLTLILVSISALISSSSYVAYNPLIRSPEPKTGETCLNATSNTFTYYIYKFTLKGEELGIQNLVTGKKYTIPVSSDKLTIYTVSNTSIVYVYSGNSLIKITFSNGGPSNVSYEVSKGSEVGYVYGYEVVSTGLRATLINVTTIQVNESSDEHILFTPGGYPVEFKDPAATSFYEYGQALLIDLSNNTSLLCTDLGPSGQFKGQTLKGELGFPYEFNGEVIFYNFTSNSIEEEALNQTTNKTGGGSISITQTSASSNTVRVLYQLKVKVTDVLYLSRLIIVSGYNGNKAMTCIYELNNQLKPLKVLNGQIATAIYNVTGKFVLYGNGNTTILDQRFNVTEAMSHSVTYYVNGVVVVEYLTLEGNESFTNVCVLEENNSKSFSPPSGVIVTEQPIFLGNALLAFQTGVESGLTSFCVLNLSSGNKFEALSYYSNTTYEFQGFYYYKGVIYNQTNGTLVCIVNITGPIHITRGLVDITLTKSNVSLILPDGVYDLNGNYTLTYQNGSELLSSRLDLTGTSVKVTSYVPPSTTPPTNKTATQTSIAPSTTTSSSETSTTSNKAVTQTSTTSPSSVQQSIPSAPPSGGVAPPPSTTPSANIEEVVLIVIGYASIIGIYAYRRKK